MEQHDDGTIEDTNVLQDVGELCLLAALDPERLAEELGAERSAAFCADARNAAEIVALRGFLGEMRTGLADERRGAHSRAARRVTRRVLARSTREERGWRGDLRLVGDFVADRLRASAWLRVAAAALFVQVTVVPILAWHMLRDPGAGAFQLRMERLAEPLELVAGSDGQGDSQGASSELQIESPALDPTLPVLPFAEVAPALTALGERICAEYGQSRVPPQSAREVLAAGLGATALGSSATEQALAERALVLASGGSAEIAPTLGASDGPPSVVRLVQLEQALDRRALLGHASELSRLLDAHGATLAVASADSLASAAQRRALALQVVPHPVPGAGAERAAAALVPGAAYGEALGAALAAEGAGEGPWAQAWLRALAEQR